MCQQAVRPCQRAWIPNFLRLLGATLVGARRPREIVGALCCEPVAGGALVQLVDEDDVG